MLDGLLDRLALATALRAARRRQVLAWRGGVASRRVQVILPQEDAALHDAWMFVRWLDLPPEQVTPIALSGTLSYVPDAYAGHVRRIEAAEKNRLGLPRKAVLERLWGERPDVAVDLSQPFSAAGALLVGGGPAALRVGLYDVRAEPFYDLLVAPGADGAADAVGRYLAALNPPALPFVDVV
ncbi:MAG TPA: hypothetical protein VK610_09570 [Rhodothermales bacterium]|nr:hypothetical protein [Rhodothermales bacterium]